MASLLKPGMAKLPTAAKLRLVAELWDSITDDSEIELSKEQLAEIQRRLDATDARPGSLVKDAQMRRRLGWAK